MTVEAHAFLFIFGALAGCVWRLWRNSRNRERRDSLVRELDAAMDAAFKAARGDVYGRLIEQQPWLEDPRFEPGSANDWILETPMAAKWAEHIKRTDILH